MISPPTYPSVTGIQQHPGLYRDFEIQRKNSSFVPIRHSDTMATIRERASLLKQPPFEYMGYIKEIADVWEPMVHHIYGEDAKRHLAGIARRVSWLYILADEIVSGLVTYQNAKGHELTCRLHYATAIVGQTALFQLIANYLVPTAIVKTVQKTSQALIERFATPALRRNPLFLLGLPAVNASSVLLLKDTIDEWTDRLLDHTYDRWANRWLAKTEAPILSGHYQRNHNKIASVR